MLHDVVGIGGLRAELLCLAVQERGVRFDQRGKCLLVAVRRHAFQRCFSLITANVPLGALVLRDVAILVLLFIAGALPYRCVTPIPERLGPWRILRPLGAGAMGTVHLAELAEGRSYGEPGFRLALKVLRPEFIRSAGATERFRREAAVGIRIRDSHVVHTYEADIVVVDSVPYHVLALEFVEGRTLRDLFAELETVPEELLRGLGAQIARGLQAVHDAGAIHRDLKPENVLVTPDHQVKLSDLGIVRLDDTNERGMSLTQGAFVGTMHYAAPEQFSGVKAQPAADLYALGIVLYEAATGVQPFRAEGFAATMGRHLNLVPERASSLRAGLTQLLDELTAALLGKQPEHRMASAEAVAEVLEMGERSAWWRSQQQRSPQAPPRPDVRRDTPLIGRERELAELDAAFAATTEGRGGFVLLSGEGGIGKSRLVDEFVRRVGASERPPHVLYGAARSGARGVRTLDDALLGHLGGTHLEERLGAALASVPELIPAFAARLRGTRSPEGVPALPASAVATAYVHVARSLARERPVLWILDDLHWAGPDVREHVAEIARAADGQRVMFLATARPQLGTAAVDRFQRVPGMRTIKMDRMAEDDLAALARAAFGVRRVAPELVAMLVARTGGNPFFAFELLREMRARGIIARAGKSSWRLVTGAGALPMPDSLRDLLRERLAGLATADRRLLDFAAVAGDDFDPGFAADVLGTRRLAVLQLLAELERRTGLVRTEGARFRLDHHLLQEVLYEDLAPELRRGYHGELAESIATKQTDGDVSGMTAVALLRHAALGGDAKRVEDIAVRALTHLAFRGEPRAVRELALAAEAVDVDPAVRFDLVVRRAEALHRLAWRDEEEAAAIDAVDLAERTGGGARSAEALFLLARHAAAVGRFEDAVGFGCEAADDAHKAGEQARLATVQALVTQWLKVLARHEDALIASEKALKTARASGAADALRHALGARGSLLMETGIDPAKGQALLEESVRVAEKAGSLSGRAAAHATLAWLGYTRYDAVLELANARRAGELYGTLGDRAKTAFMQIFVASALGALGRYEEALAVGREAQAFFAEADDKMREAEIIATLCPILEACGDFSAARERATRGLALGRAAGAPNKIVFASQDFARACIAVGDTVEARTAVQAVMGDAQRIGTKAAANLTLILADCDALDGDLPAARERLEEVLATYRRDDDPQRVSKVAFRLGRVLLEAEETDAARAAFEEAERARLPQFRDPGPLPCVYLALMDCASTPPGPPTNLHDLEPRDDLPVLVRAETWAVLARAGVDGAAEQAETCVKEVARRLPPDAARRFCNIRWLRP